MIYVLYHDKCADGFGAAYAAWRKFHTKATYIPVQYHKPVPELPGCTELYIVDFAYPRDILLELNNKFKTIVLDHHKTNQKDLEGLPFCIFNMEKSGAVIAWEYFHPHDPLPQLFKSIQDRDLWEWKLPFTEEVSLALFCYPYEFQVWDELFDRDFTLLRQEGIALTRKQKLDTAQIAQRARRTTFEGLEVLLVNTPIFQGEVSDQLLKANPDIALVICYADTKEGFCYCSMRSRKSRSYDINKIAEKFGGGGHPSAAGFLIECEDRFHKMFPPSQENLIP